MIFEPMNDCCKKLARILNKNRVSADKYEILPFALSDTNEISDGMQCCTLDEIAKDYTIPFGVLKADIEGMGLKFVKGAEQIIRKDRPLLALAIYHDADEFTGIYTLMKSWNINYKFELKQLAPLIPGGELTLFAYPAEWENSAGV